MIYSASIVGNRFSAAVCIYPGKHCELSIRPCMYCMYPKVCRIVYISDQGLQIWMGVVSHTIMDDHFITLR